MNQSNKSTLTVELMGQNTAFVKVHDDGEMPSVAEIEAAVQEKLAEQLGPMPDYSI